MYGQIKHVGGGGGRSKLKVFAALVICALVVLIMYDVFSSPSYTYHSDSLIDGDFYDTTTVYGNMGSKSACEEKCLDDPKCDDYIYFKDGEGVNTHCAGYTRRTEDGEGNFEPEWVRDEIFKTYENSNSRIGWITGIKDDGIFESAYSMLGM
jgi:hypothetical protein